MVTQGDSAWTLPGAHRAAVCGHSSPSATHLGAEVSSPFPRAHLLGWPCNQMLGEWWGVWQVPRLSPGVDQGRTHEQQRRGAGLLPLPHGEPRGLD